MAIVRKYLSRVVSLENRVEGVYTLEFSSPAKTFIYAPGQFLHLAIDTDYDGTGQWPESRCFSMQSNPDEENIRITYAVKGRYTKMMEGKLNVGSEVWLKLPYGDLFSQPHNKVNTVFIAGGTGITPFLSLFTHTSFSDYSNPRLYLGFRSERFNIYNSELNKVCNLSRIVKYLYEDNDGRLDIRQIFRENGTTPDYFISGPPEMINYFKGYLISVGVQGIRIRTDDWQ